MMNKRFNNKHYWLAIFVVSIMMSGCDMFPPKEKDLIGIWQAEDGGQIIYREDGTCSLIHVKSQVMSKDNQKYFPHYPKSRPLGGGGGGVETSKQ